METHLPVSTVDFVKSVIPREVIGIMAGVKRFQEEEKHHRELQRQTMEGETYLCIIYFRVIKLILLIMDNFWYSAILHRVRFPSGTLDFLLFVSLLNV